MSDTGGQSDRSEDDRVLVAEFALDLLDENERRTVVGRIATEPALAAELRLWRGRLATLDIEFAEEAPPERVLRDLEGRLFAEPPPERVGWWNSLRVWRSLAGAAAAVAVLALGFNLLQPPRLDPNMFASQLVAVMSEAGSDVSFVAVYDPMTGMVRLTSLSGAQVPDKDYELWAIEGSKAPVSMGVIHVDSRSEMPMPKAMPFREGTVLAVTLEQKGGSPTGAAQGPIVAKGAATMV